MEPEDKIEEYYEKWGPYQLGNTEDDHRLVAHICMDLEHEYQDINLFHDFSWRFYYERGYGKHLEDAVKDFGIKVKQENELSILEAIKKLKPYAKIYKTEDDDYGATWCVVWPDDPALRKEDMILYYKEAVHPKTKEWIFLPMLNREIEIPCHLH